MDKFTMAAIGAMILFALAGAGCATRSDVSAMVRTDDARGDASRVRVAVDLAEIVTP